MLNKATGKFEYRKKYIWGIKNSVLKVVYYLYDQGSRSLFDETQDFVADLFIKAVRYAVNERKEVCRYVNDGRAEIDNNTAERLMKPVCLGRKNYLFCGSEQATKNMSLIYSIIESCMMNGFHTVKYIAGVLRKLISDETDYMALLPTNIAK